MAALSNPMLIGVIPDTQGPLRPEAPHGRCRFTG